MPKHPKGYYAMRRRALRAGRRASRANSGQGMSCFLVLLLGIPYGIVTYLMRNCEDEERTNVALAVALLFWLAIIIGVAQWISVTAANAPIN